MRRKTRFVLSAERTKRASRRPTRLRLDCGWRTDGARRVGAKIDREFAKSDATSTADGAADDRASEGLPWGGAESFTTRSRMAQLQPLLDLEIAGVVAALQVAHQLLATP